MPITVAFAIGIVSLLVVTDQVGEREPIVRGDKVDARIGSASVIFIKIAASRKAVSKVRDQIIISTPESADGISIDAVPFRPQGWKIPLPDNRLRPDPTARLSA